MLSQDRATLFSNYNKANITASHAFSSDGGIQLSQKIDDFNYLY